MSCLSTNPPASTPYGLSDGFSLVEVLVSISLISLLLVISLPTVRAHLVTTKELEQSEQIRDRMRQCLQALRSGMVEAQIFRALRTIELLPAITTAQPGLHPLTDPYRAIVEHLPAKRRIKPDSLAIRFLVLDPTVMISRLADEGRSCFRTLNSGSQTVHALRAHSNWLSFSSSGDRITLGKIPIKNWPSKGEVAECLQLSAIGSADSNAPLRLDTIGLIPIRDHFLLYLDSQGTFRRHSLVTNENQPIAYGIEKFSLLRESNIRETVINEISISAAGTTFNGNKLTFTKEIAIAESRDGNFRSFEIFR